MKESSGFKESASFSNSETCMLEELILSLSMGHLCEFFYLGENWACAFLNVCMQLLLALIAKFIKKVHPELLCQSQQHSRSHSCVFVVVPQRNKPWSTQRDLEISHLPDSFSD